MAGTPHVHPAERFPDVELRQRRGWLLYLGLLILLLNGFVRHLLPVHSVFGVLLSAFIAPLLAIPLLAAWRRWPRRRRGELTVDGRGLVVEGETVVVKRRAVKKALAFLDGEEHVVRVTRNLYSIHDVRVPTAAEAERLLTALGHSERQVTATFRAVFGPAVKRRTALLCGVASVLPAAALSSFLLRFHPGLLPALGALLIILTPALLMLAWTVLRMCQVTVGADGIAVRQTLRRTRFIPFPAVRKVGLHEHDVTVSITGESAPLVLGCAAGHRRVAGIDADAPALTLHRRIEDARHRAAEPLRLPARALLERGSSTREEWRRRLDLLAEEAGSYRASTLPADELWNVLVDPQESAEVRAGAALAVRRRLDDEGRARVRIAASTIADAPLRRIFTAVNKGDEAELEAALETLAPARARRSGPA